MNIYDQIYEAAFNDELQKVASDGEKLKGENYVRNGALIGGGLGSGVTAGILGRFSRNKLSNIPRTLARTLPIAAAVGVTGMGLGGAIGSQLQKGSPYGKAEKESWDATLNGGAVFNKKFHLSRGYHNYLKRKAKQSGPLVLTGKKNGSNPPIIQVRRASQHGDEQQKVAKRQFGMQPPKSFGFNPKPPKIDLPNTYKPKKPSNNPGMKPSQAEASVSAARQKTVMQAGGL